MLLRRIAILFFLFAVYAQTAFAQRPDAIIKKRFPVKSLNYEDGLLDNITSSIITDINGYTWVAAFTGLQKFNGYRLETIIPVAGNDTFIINYPVLFFGLNDSNILITIKEGILQYNPHTNRFTLLIALHAEPSFYFGVMPLKETAEGIWCMQQNKGIVLYNRQGKLQQFFSFFNEKTINGILQSDRIFNQQMITANDNFVYIYDFDKSILSVDTKKKNSFIINAGRNQFAVCCLLDKLYVSFNNYLLIIDDNGLGKQTKIPLGSSENITNTSLQKADEAHLLLSRNSYLYNVDTSGKIEYELTGRDRNSFLRNGTIMKIYADELKRIWLLTNNDVKRVQNSELRFQHFDYPGSKNNFIRALYYDEQKHVLIAGGFNGSIQLYDTLSNPLWPAPLITNAADYILAIDKLSSEEYLITNLHSGWFILNLAKKQIHRVSIKRGAKNIVLSEPLNFPNNLQRINDTAIFTATPNNVFKCVFKKGELVSGEPQLPDVFNKKLTCFVHSGNKKIWAGTNTGLVYVADRNAITHFQIPGNYGIRSMAENSMGQVCIGTEKGLFIYDDNYKLVKKISIESGLRNDCIYAIAVSGNDVYVSTNLGISHIDAKGAVQNFSKEMGLQDNEFNTNAVLKTNSGKLFFGGINGITAFYPSTLRQVNDSPLISLTGFAVNDVSLTASSGAWQGDTIQLNYHQNRLRFDAAAMGMLNVNEYVYQYRLTGFDTAWQTTYQPTNINYTLQPGSYTLEIKCHPLLSSGEEFFRNFYILITPPYWQTWWFKTIAVLCAVAIVYFAIYRYNKNKYLKKIRLLETQQQIQTERERISRELHDNIGSQLSFIISNIDWTIDSSERMTKAEELQRLTSINATAKNVMGNLRESIWALNKEKISLEEFADKLKAYIQNIIVLQPGLKFISKENIQSNITLSPTETLNVFRICQEVVNNVIKHAEACIIKVCISAENKKFSILIEDNGKGFNVTNSANGYGLENIKYRAAEMNLQINITSEPAKGTIVLIH
ncbi:MAG TPA: histidine kinase [Parafilimonas sp.]|nr:histidine kinase [Parafilimonas sp.]